MQGSSVAHQANNSVDASDETFGERAINRGLWLLRSPRLNPFICGTR
jgi:hypothetical protein